MATAIKDEHDLAVEHFCKQFSRIMRKFKIIQPRGITDPAWWPVSDYTVDYNLRGSPLVDLERVREKCEELRKKFPDKEIRCVNQGEMAVFWTGTLKQVRQKAQDHADDKSSALKYWALFEPPFKPTLKCPIKEGKKAALFRIQNGRTVLNYADAGDWLNIFHFSEEIAPFAKQQLQKFESHYERRGPQGETPSTFDGIELRWHDMWDTLSLIWKDGGHYYIDTKKDVLLLVEAVKRFTAKLEIVKQGLKKIGLPLGTKIMTVYDAKVKDPYVSPPRHKFYGHMEASEAEKLPKSRFKTTYNKTFDFFDGSPVLFLDTEELTKWHKTNPDSGAYAPYKVWNRKIRKCWKVSDKEVKS